MRVLIPVDGSQAALTAVAHVARRNDRDSGIEVELMYVLPPFPRHVTQFVTREALAGYRRALADTAFDAAARLLERHGVRARLHVASGSAPTLVAARAAETGCDAILVGTRRRSALLRLVEGSFSIRLLEASSVPVELVPGEPPSALERFGIPAGLGAGLATLLAL